MESSSSKICGEGCESSESGWTMYIGSSIHDGGDGGGYGGDGGRKTVVDDDDVDTDDSMASDASSGPGQQPSCGGETEEVNGMYKFSSKKYKKAMHKKKGGCEEERKDNGKEEIMGNYKNGVVQSCNSAWSWGRRK